MEVEEMLRASESKTLEWKRDLSSLAPILKTMVAFANTAGGTLIIGRGANGALLGIDDVLAAEERLANAVADSIRPALLPEIEIISREGKNFLLVTVSHAKGPFYLAKEGSARGVYMRLGSTSRPADQGLLEDLHRALHHVSYDLQPAGDMKDDALDREKIEVYFAKRSRKVNEEKLISLGILVPLGQRFVPSIGGLVLFGKAEQKRRFLPHAHVACALFKGTSKEHILDTRTIEGNLVEAVDEALLFIQRNTRLSFEITGTVRRDIHEYPQRALREVLINALVHANYAVIDDCVRIAIFADRLEVHSPGMFPYGFSFADFQKGKSRIRNRVIARAFHELGLMEQWGSGYDRIAAECHAEGYLLPRWEEEGNEVIVTLFPHLHSSDERPFLVFEEKKEEAGEAFVWELLERHRGISFRQIYGCLPGNPSERSVRYWLASLKRKGLAASMGSGRATLWKRVG